MVSIYSWLKNLPKLEGESFCRTLYQNVFDVNLYTSIFSLHTFSTSFWLGRKNFFAFKIVKITHYASATAQGERSALQLSRRVKKWKLNGEWKKYVQPHNHQVRQSIRRLLVKILERKCPSAGLIWDKIVCQSFCTYNWCLTKTLSDNIWSFCWEGIFIHASCGVFQLELSSDKVGITIHNTKENPEHVHRRKSDWIRLLQLLQYTCPVQVFYKTTPWKRKIRNKYSVK